MDLRWLLSVKRDLYYGLFFAVLAVVLLWEAARPAQPSTPDRPRRWMVNAMLLGCAMLAQSLLPIGTIALALAQEGRHAGALRALELAAPLAFVLGWLAMDAARYWQHRLMHRVALLWRIHRTHHADHQMDATTSFRFHPLEVLAGTLTDAAVVLVLGVPAGAVLAHQLFRVLSSTFVHGNVRLNDPLARVFGWLVMTPDLHRIHHWCDPQGQHANLSGGLSLWDRVFGTYLAPSAPREQEPALGVAGYDPARSTSLTGLLLDPLKP